MFSKGLFAAFLTWAAAATSVNAGVITGVDPAGDFNLTGIQRPSPNNNDFDGAGPSAPNSIGAQKIFTDNNAKRHSFDVAASQGVTEYFFVERVVNNSGVDWIDFHFELIGPGVEGLDFDTGTESKKTPAPTSVLGAGDPANIFANLSHMPTTIDWSGGRVNAGGSVFFTFSIDVPDGLTRFTLLERPSVAPTPATLPLMLIGLGGLAGLMALGRPRRREPG